MRKLRGRGEVWISREARIAQAIVIDFRGQGLTFFYPSHLRHNLNPIQPSHSEMTDQGYESALSRYRYRILFGAWLFVTGVAFFRVSRQPYNSRIKSEQYETIFKGTSLAAVLAGIGVSGGLNRPRSETAAGERR